MKFIIVIMMAVLAAVCVLTGCGAKDTSRAASADTAADGPDQALQAFAGLEGILRIAGGTAHLGVMEEARERIVTTNPAIRITVEGGGSGVGVKKVGEGLVEIGNTGRALSEDEIANYGLKSFAFAIDGVGVIINPANPVGALTREQVKGIFAGTIVNWKDVGGEDREINLYNRDKESGTREVFWSKALDKGDMTAKANFVKSNGAMKTGVANDPAGIGYISIGHIDDSVKAPTFDGVAPTQANAVSGTYRVTRKLFMNTKGEPDGLTRAFIDYIMGAEGAAIIAAKGYIPVR